MVRDFGLKATAATMAAVWVANTGASTFVSMRAPQTSEQAGHKLVAAPAMASAASAQESLGLCGLLAYGASFGALMAMTQRSRSLVQRKAEASLVQEAKQVSMEKVSWLKGFPPALMKKTEIEGWLKLYDDLDWENPPDGTELYFLKAYAEAYGEGKATKMSFGEWFQFKSEVGAFAPEDLQRKLLEKSLDEEAWREDATGKARARAPVPLLPFFDYGNPSFGPLVMWRGDEPFAGDQLRTVVSDGSLAKGFLNNLAFYRPGLKNWQRGIEIGMAHGYFMIGPFTKLGPLRNTPEAATVGMLAGIFILLVVTCGGLIFGATERPRGFDEPGKPRASGFQDIMYWHAIGSVGGAGFAHALITIFGNGMA